MRPLPRLLAFTDHSVRIHPSFVESASTIATLGPAVGFVARDPDATGAELAALAARLYQIATPTEAALIVSGRPDLAAGLKAHGVQLRAADLLPADARRVMPRGWIGRSVHSLEEGTQAVGQGADYLVVGPVWPTATHPGRPPSGLALVESLAALGRPVFAIGGVTPERARQAREAGAWGVAAISAVWSRGEAEELIEAQ